jgi:hypothetical protein
MKSGCADTIGKEREIGGGRYCTVQDTVERIRLKQGRNFERCMAA